jgi:hypothetical protein
MMRLGLAAVGLLGLVSCTPVPLATAYPVSLQPKTQAVEHWQILAADFAARTASIPNPYNRPIYLVRKYRGGGYTSGQISAPYTETFGSFSEAFESYLATALVSSGRVVTSSPLGARIVDYSVEPVTHGRGIRDFYPSTSLPLDAVATAADLVVGSYVSPSRAEVIVTLAVADQDRFRRELLREARNFYIRPGDAWHYPIVHMTAFGAGPPIYAPTVSMRVVDP